MAKPLENVAFWLPGLGPPASSSSRASPRQRSKEDTGPSPVSRQSSMRSKERSIQETPPGPSKSSRLKLTSPVKLPSLGRSTFNGAQTARESRESRESREAARTPTTSKESGRSPARQSSLDPLRPPRKQKTRTATGNLGFEASPAHSVSMLSNDSTDASPQILCDVLRSVEDANIPYTPRRGSRTSQSDGESSRSSPSLDMVEKSDVEDVVDCECSFSLEGIPDLELTCASPIPQEEETKGYVAPSVPVAPPPEPLAESAFRGNLQLPKASKSYVPTRAWGSTVTTATLDLSKEDSPMGSPLKRGRSYRRNQTMPASAGGGPTVATPSPDASVPRSIKSLEEGQKIYDIYYWEEVIQEDGDGGKVVVCRKKTEANTDFDKVMKIKSKLKLQKEGFAEHYRKVLLKMLSLPAHPGVMPLEEVLEDDAFYYVVTPKATSSFFDGLLLEFHDGVVPEAALRSLMTDMLEAVDHLHNYGVLHRDIKPDNMVLQTHVDEDTGRKRRRVVLIDFDHADPDFHNAHEEERIYGTRRFNAPESYLCSFSRQTDLYSIGVIFYMLMTGKMPYSDEIFDGIKPPGSRMVSPRALLNDTFQRLKDADIDWNCDPWPTQPLSMDLCR